MKLLLLLLFASGTCQANCWQLAASDFEIDAALLKALAWKESAGRPDAVGPVLADGNRAIGLMQINTVHLPALAHFGITMRDLFDACTSVRVGAWVLADCVQRFGRTWKAVGCYYTGPASRNEVAQAEYVRDVQRYFSVYKQREQAPSGRHGELAPPVDTGG